jgi:cysteate synthase
LAKLTLNCLVCGREHKTYVLACESGCNSLLRTRYEQIELRPKPLANIFKFLDWLPCAEAVETPTGPVLHRAERFGQRIGLDHLVCCVNGYWPEIGATNPTGTFKDFEALPTLLTFAGLGRKRMILASAGNTARAFAYAAHSADVLVYLVVPESMLFRIWLPASHPADRVRLIAVQGSSDYSEAIRFADALSQRYGLDPEGGARNVARRDALGTVMLEAAYSLGRLPVHYFQAVGSGTGAIAAFEAAVRLQGDPRFAGSALPAIHVSQNSPFEPIYRAWHDGSPIDPAAHWGDGEVYATVLANRNPPYAIRGGMRDVLQESGGNVYSVGSGEAKAAHEEFAAEEGFDLEPAAAVAVASLQQAVALGRVARQDLVLLNLTGGGFQSLRRDFGIRQLTPDLVVSASDVDAVAALV